jgi:hypothetical protein
MSEMCVSATARSALQRGIVVVLAHDAHATYDIPAMPGIAPLYLPQPSPELPSGRSAGLWRTQRRWLRPGLVRQTGTREPRTCWSQCRPSPETRIVSQLGIDSQIPPIPVALLAADVGRVSRAGRDESGLGQHLLRGDILA